MSFSPEEAEEVWREGFAELDRGRAVLASVDVHAALLG
jgi:hypothetical protein